MAYGKFRFEWKNFLLGLGAMALMLVLPGIDSLFIGDNGIITKIREKFRG